MEEPRALRILKKQLSICFIVSIVFQWAGNYYYHFTNENSKGWRSQISLLKPHRLLGVGVGKNTELSLVRKQVSFEEIEESSHFNWIMVAID